MTRDELIAEQLQYASWRPESETIWLVDRKIADGDAYCSECHDWHNDDEPHTTD